MLEISGKQKDRGFGDDPLVSTAGTLQVLNNNNNANFDVVFKNLFPINLSTLQFDVTAGDSILERQHHSNIVPIKSEGQTHRHCYDKLETVCT